MQFNLNLDSINYIKIVYQNREEQTCCTKAAIKRMGEREIFACAKFEEGLNISTPQEISLSFVCDNGLYRTSTTLKYIQSEPPFVFFGIKTPVGLEYQQNREYFRVKMKENVILTLTKNGVSRTLACKSHDISASGIRVELDEDIDKPDEVVLEILFDTKSVKTKAEFVRFDNEDDIFKASFKYIDLPGNLQDIISQKCIQKQLEYKRNAVKG